MKKQALVVFVILLLSSLSCSLTQRLVDITSPTEPVQAPASSNPNVLFQDDFSNSSSGWDQYSDADGITNYANGTYQITVNKTNFTFWANPGLEDTLPADLRVEVDATKAGGPDYNDFGVICRYKNTNGNASFYEFIITSDGYAGIVQVSNNSQVVISGDGKLEPFDAINQGSATNHIKAECIGNTLSLYANNAMLSSVNDNFLTDGDVGLLASSYDESGVNIQFDNFIVTRP